jgi:hypothetical protein
MNDNPSCRLCGHSFNNHKFSEYGLSWWCEVDGQECGCDSFLLDQPNREAQFDNYNLN